MIFGNQLAKELEAWERPPGNGTLLQYVDDILIATEKDEECKEWTVSLLNFLGLSGYRVSLQKAQILKKEVIYLGFVISKGQRQLGNDRKEAICRTPEPTTVKELRTFLGMTDAVQLPSAVAIMHCKGHQKGNTDREVGNKLADHEARQAAEQGEVLGLIPEKSLPLPEIVEYDEKDQKLITDLKAEIGPTGWAMLKDNKIVVPFRILWKLIKTEHDKTHWGTEALYNSLTKQMIARNLFQTIKTIVDRCEICLKNNPKLENQVKCGSIGKGNVPGQNWQIDFTELPRKGGHRYLLVLTDTFSGWPEAFPCRTNKAQVVTKVLLREIIPRFGVPEVISSDRGPRFVSQVVQQVILSKRSGAALFKFCLRLTLRSSLRGTLLGSTIPELKRHLMDHGSPNP
ncbi:uncharacterized protein LOC135316457 [Phalacrocorax carbo]|uniref:uncharacterized protein LOC135316457 n=1 Tax=Phalacrocorax carbo TaxID=9209 RepID=UPI003119B0FC